jgi:hypothetical protein
MHYGRQERFLASKWRAVQAPSVGTGLAAATPKTKANEHEHDPNTQKSWSKIHAVSRPSWSGDCPRGM